MKTAGSWIKDSEGRSLILRGVNLSGSTKVPYQPDGATYRSESFFDHRTVSFIGRPFPLNEADAHFARLRRWGMTFLRFLITWEAIEHAGPGQYDEAYLDYLYAILKKAADYDIQAFIDPHQDVWSRWTGGDGAPGWTLEAVGMDLTRLFETGAAINHQQHGDPFPRMIWPTNYTKLAAATMFTLFFGGNDFAPKTRIDGQPAQEYLQSHYINAVRQVALRLQDLPNVVGYDTLNEPGSGFIGVEDAGVVSPALLRLGSTPTPFQAMLLGTGYPQEVAVYELGLDGGQVSERRLINPNGVRLWRPGYDCPWHENGVWDDGDKPRLLRPAHFAAVNGRRVDFANDYLKPFVLHYTAAIREVDPDAIIFIEGTPTGQHLTWANGDPKNVVNAGHWYDGLTLFTKQFMRDFSINAPTGEGVVGEAAVAQLFVDQIGAVKKVGDEAMGGVPTLVGEFGIPFDLDYKRAFTTGDFSTHEYALDLYYDAMDKHLLSCTLWNYTPDNTNAHGDLWNDEDLSIFSQDHQHDPADIHSGGRGLRAVVRPYTRCIAGTPLQMHFEMETGLFEFRFRHDPDVDSATEIFLPDYQYPRGCLVEVSDGEYEIVGDRLIYHHSLNEELHTIRVWPVV